MLRTGYHHAQMYASHYCYQTMAAPSRWSLPLPWKPIAGSTAYASFVNSESLEVYRIHHNAPLMERTEIVVARWQMKKAVNDFEQCLNKEKHRVSIDDRRRALAQFAATV